MLAGLRVLGAAWMKGQGKEGTLDEHAGWVVPDGLRSERGPCGEKMALWRRTFMDKTGQA